MAFAFRTGLFNIGGAGQMLMGGLCATLVALWVPLPKFVMLPVMMVAAMLGGALWAAVPGLLKARFNVHEVVSTIMMNWMAYWAIYYFIPAYLKSNLETESRTDPRDGVAEGGLADDSCSAAPSSIWAFSWPSAQCCSSPSYSTARCWAMS